MQGTRRAITAGTTLTATAAVALLLASAVAGATTTTIDGAKAPGPKRYDEVFVTKVGPKRADRVLVLVPGTIGGAGDFSLVARDVVERVPNLRVWLVDRRSQALEDTSLFEGALRGQASADDAFDYYLRWIVDPSIQPHYEPLDDDEFGFVRDWGLEVSIRDLRHVVKAAGKGGREVILGGHSLGASTALAYAAWDFRGRPGYREIDGLVLIDGGLLGSFDGSTRREAEQDLAELEQGSPFTDLLGLGLPWTAGVFVEAGALYAKQDPTAPSAIQQFPLLPAEFNPGATVTNRALLGYALDADTSPAELALIHVRAGRLASSGDPRDWEDGEVTPVGRLADTLAQEPANGVEWYYPRRLNIDVDGADKLRRNRVTKFLDLRTWHARKVDVPLYAFQTSLTGGDVLRGARRFVKRSAVRSRDATLVDRSATTSHLDPLTAAPETNDFLDTVAPFLKGAVR
jgi:pimeloyl-ACP methyl ester carboxylesterase